MSSTNRIKGGRTTLRLLEEAYECDQVAAKLRLVNDEQVRRCTASARGRASEIALEEEHYAAFVRRQFVHELRRVRDEPVRRALQAIHEKDRAIVRTALFHCAMPNHDGSYLDPLLWSMDAAFEVECAKHAPDVALHYTAFFMRKQEEGIAAGTQVESHLESPGG